jgi:SAM-dependent methyltransferase
VVFYQYGYMFQPRELCFLVSCATGTNGLPGAILEVGCAGGNTTVFLCKHLDSIGDERKYFCLDTFEGFVREDIDVEIARGKDAEHYSTVFKAYRKKWFDKTMANNRIERVISIKGDANTFDFRQFSELSFCLVDVDLYRPVRRALDEVIPRMAPGGIIVVDDCTPNQEYDGALVAYLEASERHGFAPDIKFDKLGVIKV